MKVVDVNTMTVIDETDCPVPKYWYTTKEGWEQHKKDYKEYEEEWAKIERELLYKPLKK